jgi:hypothetical protein
MNMKLAINRKTNLKLFNRPPINFWETEKKVEEDSMTITSYEESISHEVKYNPANKESDSYKVYIKPFSHSMLSNGSNSWINSTLLSKATDLTKMVWCIFFCDSFFAQRQGSLCL